VNILDYLDINGSLTFRESPLNEVDNVIFSTLAYLRMDGFVNIDGSISKTLPQLLDDLEKTGYDTSTFVYDPMKLLRKAASTARYQQVTAGYYISLNNSEQQIQFAAVTFSYDACSSYIAFRGTDNTLTGWREDFNLSCQDSTPGQIAAADYINYVSGKTGDSFIVGGHSKGGNFAVYGSAFCEAHIRDSRICLIYSNDGPGFSQKTASTASYNRILPKLIKIIPESSYIGILLSSKARSRIITSSARGAGQHNPYSWNVLGNTFESADSRSFSSLLVDSAVSTWVNTLENEEKKLIINSLFDTLESSGFETLRDMKAKKIQTAKALLKGAAQLKPEHRKQLLDAFGKFFKSGKTRIPAEIMKAISGEGNLFDRP